MVQSWSAYDSNQGSARLVLRFRGFVLRMRSVKPSGKYIEPSLPGRGSMGAPDALSLCTFALSYAHDVDVSFDPHGVGIHPAQAEALRAVEPRKLLVSSCIGR